MSDDIFRIVVAVAVAVASLAFLVQAGILFAIYRVARKTQVQATGFMDRVEPVIAKVGPTLDQAGPVIQRIGPAIEHFQATVDRIGPVADNVAAVVARFGPIVDRVGPLMDRVGPVVDRIAPVLEKAGVVIMQVGGVVDQAGVFVERATQIATTTNRLIAETGPKVAEISEEAVAMARTSRQQIERAGELLDDAGDRARTRLAQIDSSIESTVEQVEQVSGAMKRAVMRPVREVNGLAAGISAAVNTFVHRQHKSSVDAATIDEEMFI
jgi:ABC-type transporter Mla subunit MlaD